MSGTQIITAGALAALILEGLKWLYCWLVVKNYNYDFPTKFYVVAIPVLSYLCGPLLAFLGVSGYVMPVDWMSWGKMAVVVLLSSAMALGTYKVALQGFSASARGKLTGTTSPVAPVV
jgi:hypothetical protein